MRGFEGSPMEWGAYRPGEEQLAEAVGSLPFEKVVRQSFRQAAHIVMEKQEIIDLLQSDERYVQIKLQDEFGESDEVKELAEEHRDLFPNVSDERERRALIVAIAMADAKKDELIN